MADSLPALGERLYLAMRRAWRNLPESTQLVLLAAVGNASTAWALALLLAAWRITEKGGAEATATEATLNEAGALSLLRAIQSLKASLPRSFTAFIDAAATASDDGERAAAASYFQSAVNDLGGTVRAALHGWLSSSQFRTGAVGLTARYPEPGGPMLPQTRTETLSSESRAARFDRVGFRRPSVVKASIEPEPAPKPAPTPPPTTPTPAPTPRADASVTQGQQSLGGRELTKAFLISRGWRDHDADRFLQGPDKSHLTAEGLFRSYRALPKEERGTLISELAKRGLWTGLDEQPGSIVDVQEDTLAARFSATNSLAAYKEYTQLPLVERLRFLKLIRRHEQEVPVPPNNSMDQA